MLGLDDFGPADHEPFGQPGPHGLGDIGHRVEVGDAAVVEPMEHLLGSQPGGLGIKPGYLEQFGDPLFGQADQIYAAVLTRGYVARGGNGIELSRDCHECGVGHRPGHIGAGRPKSYRNCAQPSAAASSAVAAPSSV